MTRNHEMDNATINAVLAEIDLNGRSNTEVATADFSLWQLPQNSKIIM
jgi:hypothetical protein